MVSMRSLFARRDHTISVEGRSSQAGFGSGLLPSGQPRSGPTVDLNIEFDYSEEVPDIKNQVDEVHVAEQPPLEQAGGATASRAPATPLTRFTVTLSKVDSSVPLGIVVTVDRTHQSLFVSQVLDGLVSRWNSAHSEHRVKVGDHILAVNGFFGNPQELMDKAVEGVIICLLLEREESVVDWPHEECDPKGEALLDLLSVRVAARQHRPFRVNLEIGDAGLGVEVQVVQGCVAPVLQVKSLAAGVVQEWNDANPPELQVRVGDLLVEVNGFSGDIAELVKRTTESFVDMLFVRDCCEQPLTVAF